MDNGMIRKYQKAKMYAEERARFKFQRRRQTFILLFAALGGRSARF